MNREFVYILTNPCLDGWVKIGRTNNITSRLRELNQPSNMPLSFRIYATYEVNDAGTIEQSIHKLIDTVDVELHASETLPDGRIRVREFFQISPEKAYRILSIVAELRGEAEYLKIYEPDNGEKIEENIGEEAHNKRRNLTFDMIKIPIGTELTFLYDDTIKCVTADNKNQIYYNDESYSLSGLARILLVEKCGWRDGASAHGGRYFMINGETLTDRRERIEQMPSAQALAP